MPPKATLPCATEVAPLPSWLVELGQREIRPGPLGLHVIRDLLERLGNPHRGLVVVHVAGTRGKGSTSALVASALRQAGCRTGLTTSPHLRHPRERICLDGEPLEPPAFLALVQEVRSASSGLDPSFFEILIASALLAFARARVDACVVEVGLGGRLDATSIVTPAVAVITRLGRDHAERLGPTAESVAYEKAGILKRGCRAVLAPNGERATAIVTRRAAELGISLFQVGSDDVLRAPATSLAGATQRENAATARAALAELCVATEGRVHADDDAMTRGFRTLDWPCRLELLPASRTGATDLLLDVAHDVDGVLALVHHLDELGRLAPALVFTCLGEKDLQGMARVLAQSPSTRDATILVPALSGPRARAATSVAAELLASGLSAVATNSVAAALEAAFERSSMKPGGLVVAFGSFLVADGVLRALEARRAQFEPVPRAAQSAGS